MIKRALQQALLERLDEVPAVVLLGPRQVGKTTMAQTVATERDAVYLDLESERDRAKMADTELYLRDHTERLMIFDEIHRLPDLFRSLRGAIDEGRRRGKKSGRFLLLGSASLDLIKQSSESLAGRISYMELTPFHIGEIPVEDKEKLWLRGGFPESFLAGDDKKSFRWRRDLIRSYLERDIPQFGERIPAETLLRFWTMLAHNQAGLLNAAQLARNLAVDGKKVAHYLDLLADLFLVRRLQPWHRNQGKRLVRAPKVFIRDSGLLHALLMIEDREQLLGHMVVGGSWEGFVIETLLAAAPDGVQASFYRTSAGAEIDLLLTMPGNELWAVEIKRSLSPKLDRGFHYACRDLMPNRCFVVYAGTERYPAGGGVEVISLRGLADLLTAMHEN